MNFSNFKWALAVLSLAVLASCGDDNKNDDIDNPEGPQGSGTMEVMTPEQSKTYLQNAVVDFLNKFNPEDQKDAIELAAYFSQEYADLEAPEEFEIEPDGNSRTPGAFLKAIAAAAKGDMDGLTRAANAYSYTLNFDRFTGVYEPSKSKGEWVKTENSNDVVFKFTNKSAQPVVLTVTQSGGVSDFDFSLNDWDYDYNYDTGYWEEYEVKYNYYLSIPKTVTANLTENGQELANTVVVSNIDVDGHTISADVNATLMNLKTEAKISGNDSKVEANSVFYVSGEKVGSAYATLTGSDLCNKKKYESFEDMDDDQIQEEIAKMINKGDCGADLLGMVQVYGQVSYYKDMPDDLDFYADDYDYNSKEEARNDCQKACNRLNENIKTQLRYDNTATDQASLQFIPGFDEWYGGQYWEYFVTCNLLFPDNTSYNIDSYFENFSNVTNKWDTLLDAYEKIWDTAGGRK